MWCYRFLWERHSAICLAEAAFEAVYYKGPWPFINRAWGKAAWHQMDESDQGIDLLDDEASEAICQHGL